MKVALMLCDAAQVVEGKLYILGGGWSVTGPTPTPSAVAAKIDVPWDRTNERIEFSLALLSQDGQPVEQRTPIGLQEVNISGEFEVGRPPGVPQGSAIDVPLAVTIGPIDLAPGGRYEWRLTIDGQHDESWTLPFNVRPAAPTQPHR